MSIFIIRTVETIPAIREYEYSIEAIDAKEAEKKLRNGKYNDVSFVKEIDTLAVTDTQITNIEQID
jgi:hypothetical protein